VSDQSYDIDVDRDESGGTRRVWVNLAADGRLELSGHDLGSGVSEFWGEDFDEYEWSWTLHPSRVPALFDALRVDFDSEGAVLELAVRLRAIGARAAQKHFQDAGAEFWSRLGD
jgi:hypothetical protein